MTTNARLTRRARRDLDGVLHDLQERARTLLTARLDPLELITEMRRPLVDAHDGVTYAVLHARAAGYPWGVIAARLGEDEAFVQGHYEPVEARWVAREGIHPDVHATEGQPLHLLG